MASIDENNPTMVDGLVNFQKMEMIYKVRATCGGLMAVSMRR